MADIFLKIVNMSISASWIVLAVLVLRLLLKKAPKWINGILWGIVGLRLIMPFSLESVFSLIPSSETISKVPDAPRPHFESGVTIIDNRVNDYLGGHYYEGVTRPTGHFADITTILAIAWIVGIVVLLAYTVISYLRVKNKIGTAVLLRDNIFQSENVVSPFVLGIIKPKIYLPFNMNEQDMNHVIAHENAHIRRKDHWWKPFGFLVLTLHWFNPLMWLGYALLCRDIELACDEKVVKEFNNEQKADYSQALLTCSVNRRIIAACPLAFGEVGVKNRVKSVLNYKKPAFWIVVTAIVVIITVAVCSLTNPVSNKLGKMENNNLWSRTAENTAVSISNGVTTEYIGAISVDLLDDLYNLKISKKEISLSRDEERDKTNTIVLNLIPEDEEQQMKSYANSTYIHFSADFTSVWINDGVKPTFSYKVMNPQKAKEVFGYIKNYNVSESVIGGADEPTNIIVSADVNQLKEKYPQFFNVSTDGGLTVYIWQMAENSYNCYLANTYLEAISDNSFTYDVGATIPETRAILTTYNIGQKDITVQPVINPLSSYFYEIDDAYRAKIKELFWKDSYNNENVQTSSSYDEWGLKMDILFKSATEFDAVFNHNSSKMTVKGTLTTSPEFEIKAIHNGKSIPYGEYMRNVLKKDYEDPEFAWDTVLYTIAQNKETSIDEYLLGTYDNLPVGQYLLCKKVILTTESGERKTKVYTADFAITD